MVQCLTVDCPIAISSENCQLLLDCIEEVKDCRTGNLLALFLDSLLQRWDWSCLPSNFVNCLFKHGDGALRHLSMWRFKVVLSEVGNTVNHHNYIRFLRIAVIPFIRRHYGSGCYWLLMNLASAHCTNNMLIFFQQQGFIPKDADPPYIALLRPVEGFWPTLKKAFHDGGWEATSIPALKRRIKRGRQISVPTILFNTVKLHLAVFAWNGLNWVVYS